MPPDAKERIRDLIDIAEVIGETVALKPAGSGRLKGLCPFHNEKTPSFHVHRDRGFYYCFGCQAKGDVFDFVMQTEGLSFGDVLRRLGARVGVEVEPPTPGQGRRTDLYRVNEAAQEWFLSNLEGPALEYLLARGLTRESIERFGLGFAPEGWDGLLAHAARRGVDPDRLMEAGLLSQNDSGRRYDRFRGRVIFPIRDQLGRLVGFSGRILAAGEPKYLNTPETEVFRKGEILYGLELARPAIRSSGECIVVEGYMDVIALHQVGIGNAVAALGATLTVEQADLLSRQDVRRLHLAFDADSAGERAVLAGLDRSIGRQFLVRAVRLPSGKDPADAVLQGDPAAFLRAVERGESEVEYRLTSTLRKYDAGTDEGRQAILNELMPSLRPRAIIDPVASELKRLLVDRLGVNEAALTRMIESSRGSRVDAVQARGLARPTDRIRQLEMEIIALLLLEPAALETRLAWLAGAMPDLEESALGEFLELARACGFEQAALLDRYRERADAAVVFARLLAVEDDEGARRDLDLRLEKELSRLREFALGASSAARRRDILGRMDEVKTMLSDPELPRERLDEYYAELGELSALLAARDAERRLRSQRR